MCPQGGHGPQTAAAGGSESGAGACSLGYGSCLAHLSLVVVEHERRLNVVGERVYLQLAEQVAKQRKDPLARRRIRRDGVVAQPSLAVTKASTFLPRRPYFTRNFEKSRLSTAGLFRNEFCEILRYPNVAVKPVY